MKAFFFSMALGIGLALWGAEPQAGVDQLMAASQLAGEQIRQFAAGHAGAAVGQIQAPPPHRFRAEHLQSLQHPPEKTRGIWIIVH